VGWDFFDKVNEQAAKRIANFRLDGAGGNFRFDDREMAANDEKSRLPDGGKKERG
jgi:hypothetical protein